MKNLMLTAIAICGIQIATAQTVTPSPDQKHHSNEPSNKIPSDKKAEKKSGSTGTYTTGAEVPGNAPADTATTNSRKPKPMMDPEGRPKN
ncbi:hypothetical protein CNR22_04400 [Sphingobacteriaceae bacterium]|nr:hypothetical protein CNR22_04400 [Sphingobacteriaceae bacterium]